MAISRVNRFLVTVEKYNEYDCSGRLFTPLQDQVVHFDSFTELVLRIERQLVNTVLTPDANLVRNSFLSTCFFDRIPVGKEV